MPVVQRRLVRPIWMTGGEVNDWPEDASHENGQYFNRCLSCDGDFIGHKRRHQCRKCHYEAKARYDAMTPDERAASLTAHDRAHWGRMLPPTIVGRAGTEITFWVHVDHGADHLRDFAL